MNKRQRFIEIDAELRQLSQRRQELLEERRNLSGMTKRTTIAQVWVDPTFEIIKKHPGISRREIFIKLNDKHLKFGDLTNVLTTLRRRGWIENHGTRKYPKWHVKAGVVAELAKQDAEQAALDNLLDQFNSSREKHPL